MFLSPSFFFYLNRKNKREEYLKLYRLRRPKSKTINIIKNTDTNRKIYGPNSEIKKKIQKHKENKY